MARGLFFAASMLSIVAISAAVDALLPEKPLLDGRFLVSSDEVFKLGFFSPANSSSRYVGVWYNRIPVQTVVWVANRDNPLPDKTGMLSLSSNGSLSISVSKGLIYWSTPSARFSAGTTAKLLPGGNFVVSGAGDYFWQSFDHPTDSVLPGMKVGINRRTGSAKNVTSWKSPADPATGEFTMYPDYRGDPQTFLMKGKERLWRSGPWVGERFSGIPQMNSYDVFKLSFVVNEDEAYYLFTLRNKSMLSRLAVQPEGKVERLLWLEKEAKWNVYWSGPRDNCDHYGYCGEFGVCDASQSLLCSCLQGFEPNSPENWNLREMKEGCGRRTKLDCGKIDDGFAKVANAKIPDTSTATVDAEMVMEECGESCLRNCSCTAYAAAKIVNGSSRGCIFWSGELMDIRVYDNGGQDLFVRLARADLGEADERASSRKGIKSWVAAAVSMAAACVVGLLLLGFVRWRRKRNSPPLLRSVRSMKSQMSMEERNKHGELDLPLFDLATIAAATDDFAADKRLGEGGFGPVYKGMLEGEQEVAVKRLGKRSSQGLDEFMNEVRVIAKLQHRNLVRLLGCCIDGEERILVYEYMPNGSLDSFLFNKTRAAALDWPTKLNIIGGIARGLLYLHQDSRLRIVHRDLKSSNVLLDHAMNPKISDFGMARVFAGDETEGITRRVVGTYGYMSPEYAMDGNFSVKSDVFSFGVIVLEIISGRKNRAVFDSERKLNLLSEAWNQSLEGRELELVDSSHRNLIPIDEVQKCIKIGLLCVQERPEDRPEMATVVVMLGGDKAALPHPKPPGFVVARERSDGSSNSTSNANEVTFSTLWGR